MNLVKLDALVQFTIHGQLQSSFALCIISLTLTLAITQGMTTSIAN